MNVESKPGPIEPEGECTICHKEAKECVVTRRICNNCHKDGWREGEEMLGAITKDPNFVVHEDGSLGYVPDNITKWGQNHDQPT